MTNFCCATMERHSTLCCDQHHDPSDCPDVLMHHSDNTHGIIVHDGGSSFITIAFCPWCGTKLPSTGSGERMINVDEHELLSTEEIEIKQRKETLRGYATAVLKRLEWYASDDSIEDAFDSGYGRSSFEEAIIADLIEMTMQEDGADGDPIVIIGNAVLRCWSSMDEGDKKNRLWQAHLLISGQLGNGG